MEHARLAASVWFLRSGALADPAQPANGPAGSAALRRGIRAVPRDAAREASDAEVRVHLAVAFAGVSRGREIVPGIRAGAQGARPARAVRNFWLPGFRPPEEMLYDRWLAELLLAFFDFRAELFDALFDSGPVFGVRKQFQITRVGFQCVALKPFFFLSFP